MSNQLESVNLTGAGKNEGLRVAFNRRVKLESHGFQVTSGAGLVAYRELDEALNLTASAVDESDNWRSGQHPPHSMTAMLRQSHYSRLRRTTNFVRLWN
jgi:hypothetical protein